MRRRHFSKHVLFTAKCAPQRTELDEFPKIERILSRESAPRRTETQRDNFKTEDSSSRQNIVTKSPKQTISPNKDN
jgi:hypothetical protein